MSGITLAHEREIEINVFPGLFTVWSGTRGQIEEEGLIPNGFSWPERDSPASWSDGRVCYTIRRCRPNGMKGPKSAWIDGDFWTVHSKKAEA